MKPRIGRKNSWQSWPEYMAYVEGRIAEADMADVQSLCCRYSVGIENLAVTMAAKVNDCDTSDINAALYATGGKEWVT